MGRENTKLAVTPLSTTCAQNSAGDRTVVPLAVCKAGWKESERETEGDREKRGRE